MFNVSEYQAWTTSLGSEVLIIDVDTRVPDGENGVFNADKMNWERVETNQAGGMLSASFTNHFIYCELQTSVSYF